MQPNYQDIYNQAAGRTQSALGEYQNYQKSMTDPSTLYQQAMGQFGVNDQYAKLQNAQKAVTQTSNLIGALPEQVSQTQAGTEMTAAQRGNLMATRLQPLQQQYGAASNQFGAQQNLYQNLLGQAQTQAQLGYAGEQQKLQALQTGYEQSFGQQQQAQSNLQWWNNYLQQQEYNRAQEASMRAQAAAVQQQIAQSAAQIAANQKYIDALTKQVSSQPSPAQQNSAQYAQSMVGTPGAFGNPAYDWRKNNVVSTLFAPAAAFDRNIGTPVARKVKNVFGKIF